LNRLFTRFVRKTPRVVLDTNVLVSGTLVRHGFPARLLTLAIEKRITLVVSPYLLAEYLAVVQRPHIVKKYPQLSARLDLIRRFIQTNATLVTPQSVPDVVTADPKDNAILACALQGKARYLVSGDEHLLQLGDFHGTRVVKPREMLEALGEILPTSK
jgi:putative PIN family toxin of toxin-antitoxin system